MSGLFALGRQNSNILMRDIMMVAAHQENPTMIPPNLNQGCLLPLFLFSATLSRLCIVHTYVLNLTATLYLQRTDLEHPALREQENLRHKRRMLK